MPSRLKLKRELHTCLTFDCRLVMYKNGLLNIPNNMMKFVAFIIIPLLIAETVGLFASSPGDIPPDIQQATLSFLPSTSLVVGGGKGNTVSAPFQDTTSGATVDFYASYVNVIDTDTSGVAAPHAWIYTVFVSDIDGSVTIAWSLKLVDHTVNALTLSSSTAYLMTTYTCSTFTSSQPCPLSEIVIVYVPLGSTSYSIVKVVALTSELESAPGTIRAFLVNGAWYYAFTYYQLQTSTEVNTEQITGFINLRFEFGMILATGQMNQLYTDTIIGGGLGTILASDLTMHNGRLVIFGQIVAGTVTCTNGGLQIDSQASYNSAGIFYCSYLWSGRSISVSNAFISLSKADSILPGNIASDASNIYLPILSSGTQTCTATPFAGTPGKLRGVILQLTIRTDVKGLYSLACLTQFGPVNGDLEYFTVRSMRTGYITVAGTKVSGNFPGYSSYADKTTQFIYGVDISSTTAASFAVEYLPPSVVSITAPAGSEATVFTNDIPLTIMNADPNNCIRAITISNQKYSQYPENSQIITGVTTVTVTTFNPFYTLPGAPTAPKSTAIGITSITATWNASPTAQTYIAVISAASTAPPAPPTFQYIFNDPCASYCFTSNPSQPCEGSAACVTTTTLSGCNALGFMQRCRFCGFGSYPACSTGNVGSSGQASFTGLSTATAYKISIYSYNRAGMSASAVAIQVSTSSGTSALASISMVGYGIQQPLVPAFTTGVLSYNVRLTLKSTDTTTPCTLVFQPTLDVSGASLGSVSVPSGTTKYSISSTGVVALSLGVGNTVVTIISKDLAGANALTYSVTVTVTKGLYIVSQPPATLTATVGSTANITMGVAATSGTPSYQWYQDGNMISKDSCKTSGFTSCDTRSLIFNPVKRSQNGSKFYAVVSSLTDSVTSSSTVMTVPNAVPTWNTATDQPTQLASSGSMVIVKWPTPDTNANDPITQYELRYRVSTTTTFVTVTRTLDKAVALELVTVPSVTTAYVMSVRAWNSIGSSAWGPESLGMYAQHTPPALSFPATATSVAKNIGDSLDLTASASGLPTPLIAWYFQAKGSGTVVKVADGSNYHIQSLKRSNEGAYWPVAYNTIGAGETDDGQRVKETVSINYVPPVIASPLLPNVPNKIFVGSTFSFSVNVTGDPTPAALTCTLMPGGGQPGLVSVPVASRFTTTLLQTLTVNGLAMVSLTLTGSLRSDAGTHTCTTSNLGGSSSTTVILNVIGPPQQPPNGLRVVFNSTADAIVSWTSLLLNANGDQVDSYQIDVTGLGQATASYAASRSATSFDLKGLSVGMQYSIAVSGVNGAGKGASSTPTSFIFASLPKSVALLTNPTYVGQVPRDVSITLTCMFTYAVPQPTISWLKGGAVIDATDTNFFQSGTALLTITKTNSNVQGVYSCSVQNAAGSIASPGWQLTLQPCPPGYESDVNGACKLCNLNYYKDHYGYDAADKCLPCPQFRITLQTGANSTSLCVPDATKNFVSVTNSTTGVATVVCQAGYEWAISDAALGYCRPCATGLYRAGGSVSLYEQCHRCGPRTEATLNRTACVACKRGYVQPEGSLTCLQCQPGTYSFIPGDPTVTKDCTPCPASAFCAGGDQILMQAGFWRRNSSSLQIFQCWNEAACLGHSLVPQSNSPVEACGVGYLPNSNLCASCQESYYISDRGVCSECPSNSALWVTFSIGCVVAAVVVWLLIVRSIKNASKPSQDSVVMLKILFSHFQVISISQNFQLGWPSSVTKMFSYQQFLTSVSDKVAMIDCGFNKWMHFAPAFYQKKILYFIFLCSVLIFLVVYFYFLHNFIRRCCMKRDGLSLQRLNEQLTISVIVILFCLQSTLAKHSFQFFTCKTLTDNVSWLVEDMQMQCWNAEHVLWLVFFGMPAFMICCIGIPLLCFVLLCRQRHELFDPSVAFNVDKYGFLYRGFQPRFYYWESVIMSRKVLMASISLFFTSYGTYLQALTAMLFVVMFLILQVAMQPYGDEAGLPNISLNNVESSALLTSALTLFGGMFLYSDQIGPNTKLAVTIFVIGVNVAWALNFAYVFLGLLRAAGYFKSIGIEAPAFSLRGVSAKVVRFTSGFNTTNPTLASEIASGELGAFVVEDDDVEHMSESSRKKLAKASVKLADGDLTFMTKKGLKMTLNPLDPAVAAATDTETPLPPPPTLHSKTSADSHGAPVHRDDVRDVELVAIPPKSPVGLVRQPPPVPGKTTR